MPLAFRSLLVAAALLLIAAPASAAGKPAAKDPTIPKEHGAKRIVGLFNFLCLKQLPDLEGVERAAGFGEYDQLTGGDLAPYIPPTQVERVHGWRYHDHGDAFVLVAMRLKPDAELAKEVPAFATATGSGCILHAPGKHAADLLAELTRIMGRAPDRTRQEGAGSVNTWAHQQPGALSRVYYRSGAQGGATVLGAQVFIKN